MRLIKALVAAIVLAALLVGPPWLLVHYIGNPWPAEGVSWSAPLTDGAIIGLLAAAVWVLWAQLVVCIVVEAIAALTDDRIQLRVPFTLGVQQQIARRLVTAIVVAAVSSSVATAGAGTAAPGHAPAPARPAATSLTLAASHHQTPQQVDHTQKTHLQTTTSTADRNGPTATVTVMRLDSLWSIAERVLGDGDRWPEIAALNEGQPMNDGTRFLSADHIQPGWELRVPGGHVVDNTHGEHQIVVEKGDTLSEIALEELGDANRYPEIFQASQDVNQPGGQHLSDPDIIDVGWTIKIPGQSDTRPSEDGHDAHESGHTGTGDNETGGDAHDPTPEGQSPPADAAPKGSPDDAAPETTAPEAAGQTADDQGTEAGDEAQEAPWMLAGLTGGGIVLAGGLLLALRARRRAQFRARRPGRAIAVPHEALASVEKSVATSTAAAATVEHMDVALRRLAAWSADERVPMLSLAAVELAGGSLMLHLAAPASLPTPWQDTRGDRLHWRTTIEQSALNEQSELSISSVDAPYPLLVTVGSTEQGDVWLLNCEELAEVSISGDVARSRDFARYLVAELAVNPWSEQVRVDCIGIGVEVAPMNPGRIDYHPAANAEPTAALAVADAVTTADRANALQGDTVTGRTGQLDEDVWPARMVVLDATEVRQHAQEQAGPETGPGTTVDQLRHLVHSQHGRTGTAVVLVGEAPSGGREQSEPAGPAVEVHLSHDGRLSVASVGLELAAVGLSAEEAQGCAALLAQSEVLDDVEVPVDETAEDGWEAYVDEAGALRRGHTLPRDIAPEDLAEPVSSNLDAADEAYVREAAATPEDLETLAPQVPVRVRAELEEADPHLDQDVADWFDESCARPRLALLGPVTARTHGKPLAKRKPYFTELLAYLTLRRRHGVTPAEVADAFSIEVRKARIYVNTIRDWLGTDPVSGEPYLPHADKAPAAQLSGVPVYQVPEDVLVDVDLFRRLRGRGQARGAQGIADLRRALLLVSGRPFDQLREGGWSWLVDIERVDHYMSFAIADVAFLVTTHCLERGDVEQARAAAEIGTLAAPDEEATRLCLARVVEAEGDHVEAERIVREEVCNRSDDGDAPAELSDRTQAIIRSRAWLTGESAAS